MQNRAYLFFSMSGVPSMIRGEGVRQKMEWPILGRCGFACSGYRKHEHTEHHIYCVQNQTQPAITNHSNLQNSQAFCGSFGNTFFFVHRTNYLLDQTSYLYISSYKFLKILSMITFKTDIYSYRRLKLFPIFSVLCIWPTINDNRISNSCYFDHMGVNTSWLNSIPCGS